MAYQVVLQLFEIFIESGHWSILYTFDKPSVDWVALFLHREAVKTPNGNLPRRPLCSFNGIRPGGLGWELPLKPMETKTGHVVSYQHRAGDTNCGMDSMYSAVLRYFGLSQRFLTQNFMVWPLFAFDSWCPIPKPTSHACFKSVCMSSAVNCQWLEW